jgi:hypothetical protein
MGLFGFSKVGHPISTNYFQNSFLMNTNEKNAISGVYLILGRSNILYCLNHCLILKLKSAYRSTLHHNATNTDKRTAMAQLAQNILLD